MSKKEGEDLLVGWMEDIFLPDLMFNTERVGLENMPECFDTNTRELYYLILLFNDEFWDLLCTNTNLYVSQVKALHPNSYFKELQVCQCATGDEGYPGS